MKSDADQILAVDLVTREAQLMVHDASDEECSAVLARLSDRVRVLVHSVPDAASPCVMSVWAP